MTLADLAIPMQRTPTLPDPSRPAVLHQPRDIVGLRLAGSHTEHLLSAEQTWWLVGSSPRCDIQVVDPYSSSIHATIMRVPEGLALADRDSKNGLFVNGLRCAKAYLHVGAQIQIGTARLIAFSREDRDALTPSERLVGSSQAFAVARAAALETASLPQHLVLVGPRGSGRRTLAEAVHQASSGATLPFIELDCERLAAAETLAGLDMTTANGLGGTILLRRAEHLAPACVDAVADAMRAADLSLPDKPFLRVIVTAESAADDAGWAAVLAQATRVAVPPIWQRAADTVALVTLFLSELGAAGRSVSVSAIDRAALAGVHWPGDVADLRLAVRRAVVDSDYRLDLAPLWSSDAERDQSLAVAIGRVRAEVGSLRATAEVLGIPWSSFQRAAKRVGA